MTAEIVADMTLQRIIDYFDAKLSNGEFAVVDELLRETDTEQINDAAILLVFCNYIRLAYDNGDALHEGPAFQARASIRLKTLVGEERANKLLKMRLIPVDGIIQND